jgi:hypothetical protein
MAFEQKRCTWLTENLAAVQWVHKIPSWVKPHSMQFQPPRYRLFACSLSFYLAASGGCLIGRMELIISIAAARVVRRGIWYKQNGAGIMLIGLVLVACSDLTGRIIRIRLV